MSTGAQAFEAGWISMDFRISASQVTTRDPILSLIVSTTLPRMKSWMCQREWKYCRAESSRGK
jgi:hypothetical protein